MWFFTLLSWIAILIQLLLLTLAIATGLFYLAELVEEYTSIAAKVIRYMIYGTIAIDICLAVFESLPWPLIGCVLLAQLFHVALLSHFPYFQVTSLKFIGTCVLLLVNHYLAFSYFGEHWHPFSEVLAFFTICLWMVPFSFFVSLSANDNTLPVSVETTKLIHTGNDDLLSSLFSKRQKKVSLLSVLKYIQETAGLAFKSKKSF